MIKCNRIVAAFLVLLIIFIPINNMVYAESNAGEIKAAVNENKVSITGKLNEKNGDITIIAYRNSDNARAYIDQGTTNVNGEFDFEFSLPNGTYKAVVSSGSGHYSTENIVVHKTGSGNNSNNSETKLPDKTVQVKKGATISEKGVTIVFPSNVFDSDFQVTLKKLTNTANLSYKDNQKLLSDVFEITKNKIGNFSRPVSITLTFNKNLIDPEKYTVSIYWLDETANKWVELDDVTVDFASGSVKGNVTHFTKFAVIATEKSEVMPDDIAGHGQRKISEN